MTPADSAPQLAEMRTRLAALPAKHIELSARFLGAAGGTMYSIDLFLLAAAQRSLHLVEGFLLLWDAWNVVAASALPRLQIDNLVRVAYVGRAYRGDLVVLEFLKASSFRKMSDDTGKRLRDARLVELAADLYPWLPPVYEKASEWVHFSSRHIGNAWIFKDNGRFRGEIPLGPDRIPLEFMAELIGAMTEATTELLDWFEAWAEGKARSATTPERFGHRGGARG